MRPQEPTPTPTYPPSPPPTEEEYQAFLEANPELAGTIHRITPSDPQTPPPTTPSRVTVTESVYGECPGVPTTSATSRYSRTTASKEPPYHRPRFKIGESWKEVDLGWLEEEPVAILCIQNNSGELALVGVPAGNTTQRFSSIPAGESIRITNPTIPTLVRCLNGEATLTISAFPA